MFSEKRSNVLHGILLIALFSCSAFYIAEFPFVKNLSFQPSDRRYSVGYGICEQFAQPSA